LSLAQRAILKGLSFASGGNRLALRLAPRSLITVPYNFVLSRVPDPYLAEIGGKKMLLDVRRNQVARELFLRGTWEPFETRLVKDLVSEGDVAVDIGANIGYYSLIMAAVAKKVYAFEPDAASFNLLRDNVKLNGLDNVTLVNKAVSDRKGELRFYHSENSARGGISPFLATATESVEAVRLDDFLPSGEEVDFIKMDIEAGEPFALSGMERIVRENERLTLITEFWQEGLRTVGADPEEYLNRLFDFGFALREMREQDGTLVPVSEASLSEWIEKHQYANLLCAKGSTT
jgi:FkbM family methyltransferase